MDELAADDAPHLYLTAIVDSARWAHDLTKADRIDEAEEHVDAIDRLTAAWRRATGGEPGGGLPAWEAVYEPGNVSDYLIGYANSEAAAKGAAEGWMRSEAEVTGRLEWVPEERLATGRYDRWFELVESHDDSVDTGPGIIVRRLAETAEQPVAAPPAPADTLCCTPHHEHPETVCTEPAGHYQPERSPHAGPLYIDGQKLGAVSWDEPAATGLRDRIAEALYVHSHPGWETRYTDLDQDQRDTYRGRADAVLAVLPAPADRAAVVAPAEPFPIWTVSRDEWPAYGHFATEDIAKAATIDCWEEDEPACPDYSWRPHGGPGGWELLVGGERAGVYVARHLVYGGLPQPPRAAVWLEAAHYLRRTPRDSPNYTGALRGARLLEDELRRKADEAQRAGEVEA